MRFKRLLAAAALCLAAISPALGQAQFPAGTVWGNSTAAQRPGKAETVTAIIDRAFGSTRGSVLMRGASGWQILAPGTAGLALLSAGAGADLAYGALTIAGGGTGQTTRSPAFSALAPTPTRAGDIIYWSGSAWVSLAGNNSGTRILQEDASGLPSWSSIGTGTVTSVVIAGTAGTIAVSGTCTITTTGTCTIDLAAGRKTLPTVQTFTSGTAATYTTPANCLWIEVYMVGGGGGGAGAQSGSSTVVGSAGGTSTFNSVNAVGGSAGPGLAGTGFSGGGAGGAGGTGTATQRYPGSPGGEGSSSTATAKASGFGGASGLFGGGGAGSGTSPAAGVAGATNSGSGGSGAINNSGANNNNGSGGGGGEGVYLLINSPAATYSYTVGASGGGGGATSNGGAGAAGQIQVIEHYN